MLLQNCSLIYQYNYMELETQEAISASLQLSALAANASSCSVESYLLDTQKDYILNRVGGLSYGQKGGESTSPSRVLAWFDNQAFHAMPGILHEFYSIYARCLMSSSRVATGTGTGEPNCGYIASASALATTGTSSHSEAPVYTIYNHPISFNSNPISYDALIQKIADIGISLTILCAYSFIPAGFVVYMVRERITQEKRLQFVCGLKPAIYWLGSFVWDYVYYLVIISLTIGIIGLFGSTAYSANVRNFGALIVLLVLFGWSSLPMTYVFSGFLNDTGTAYMVVFCFTLFSGIASCIAVFLLSFLVASNPAIALTYKIVEKLSLVFPSYCLGSGLIELTKNQILSDTYALFGITDIYQDPFSMKMLGPKYISLVVTGLFFFLLIFLIESKCFSFNWLTSGSKKVTQKTNSH